MTISASHTNFAYSELEAIRTRLLDRTTRNPLLNYRFPKNKSLIVSGLSANFIARQLLENKTFSFLSIPMPSHQELLDAQFCTPDDNGDIQPKLPSAKIWADYLGYSDHLEKDNTSPDQNKLQTFFYEEELLSILGNIHKLANSSIEETGSPILYLVIGFLEWFESNDSEKKIISPLYTLPVKLEKSSDRSGAKYLYKLSLNDSGISGNITLEEKLKHDFSLNISQDSDEMLPEDYFAFIEHHILKEQPKWTIRKQAVLSLLNFTKQAMYQDLDPASWYGTTMPLEENPILQQILARQGEDNSNISSVYQSEYDIDNIENVHQEFPLVLDADSSQHTALIDAVSGKNIVIQGPPGSGKSQTITNLIAAALNNGKKVLFVAEKMAALNVVKDRLEQVGLGDFCLELHSTKVSKSQIAKDLEEKYSKHYNYRECDISSEIQRYEQYKNMLTQYAIEINTEWKKSGYTIHQILNKTANLKSKLGISEELFSYNGNLDFDKAMIVNICDQADSLIGVYNQLSEQSPENKLSKHYWYGIRKTSFDEKEEENLKESLIKWNEGLNKQFHFILELEKILNEKGIIFDKCDEIVFDEDLVPELNNNEIYDKILMLSDDNQRDIFKQVVYEYENFFQKVESIATKFKLGVLDSLPLSNNIIKPLEELKCLFNNKSNSIYWLIEQSRRLKDIISDLDSIKKNFELNLAHLPEKLRSLFTLSESGLDEYRRAMTLLNQLPNELYYLRNQGFQFDAKLDNLLSRLLSLHSELKSLHKSLHSSFILDNLPPTAELHITANTILRHKNRFFRFLSSEWNEAKKAVLGISKKSDPDFDLLPQLALYREKLSEFQGLLNRHPFLRGFNNGIETDIPSLVTLNNWYNSVKNEYGIGFGERAKAGQELLELESHTAISLKNDYYDFSVLLEEVSREIEKLKSSFNGYTIGESDNLLESVTYLCNLLNRNLSILEKYFDDDKENIDSLMSFSEQLSSAENSLKQYQALKRNLNFSIALPEKLSEFDTNLFQLVKLTQSTAENIYTNSLLSRFMHSKPTEEKYKACAYLLNRYIAQHLENKRLCEIFLNTGNIELIQWSNSLPLEELVKRNQDALDHFDWLYNWTNGLVFRQKLSDNGFNNVIENIEQGHIPKKALKDAILLSIFDSLSKQIFKSNMIVSNFNGLTQAEAVKKFQEYDRKLLKLQRQQIACNAAKTYVPKGNGIGLVSTFTDLSLISREANKTKKHISIRSLLDRASDAILALKPCFMMSPLSVAQYLKPGKFEFDLLVMDEASQILPEDALGAIARAKSVVIVGDPEQLPPTNFFRSSIESDEDDSLAVQASESILEALSGSFVNRRLQWHYRSQHESLIAFSNKHFYDDKLIIFPSTNKDGETLGIQFHKINGCFKQSKNNEEAERIVQDIVSLIKKGQESIGVVAMNSEQQYEIEQRLEIHKNKDIIFRIEFENKFDIHRLFIKNLENVQGDERDVILISMTYGPESTGGRVAQRFGPINSSSGHRRLNVLFTRAKKRMQIYSSMSSSDILPSPTTNKGVPALKAFLEYCETGYLHHTQITGKSPDSDFEEAVMRELQKYGYECEPQLGVAGFYLDLAVKNPLKPNQFLLGIECDGKTYHSAKSARDRDRLRQDILENLGWNIHRIWSTDWFRNPTAVLKTVLAKLDKLKIENFSENSNNQLKVEVLDTEGVESNVENTVSTEQKGTEDIQIVAGGIQGDLFANQVEEPLLSESYKKDYVSIQDDKHKSETLESALLKIAERIEASFPDTPKHKRLLRSEMVAYFLVEKPASLDEFNALIPLNLRANTQREEAAFLSEIFDTIVEYQ